MLIFANCILSTTNAIQMRSGFEFRQLTRVEEDDIWLLEL